MPRILLVGATGLVGQHVLTTALSDARIDSLVAPTRRALPSHPKLINPIVDFERLPADAEWWSVDGAICALGTTIAKAGSNAAVRIVDHDYPLAVARLVRNHSARRFALTSAMGANAQSRIPYNRTKGELEDDLDKLGFPSLTIVRPGLIGGERAEFRAAERIAGVLLRAVGPLLPRRYRISPAARIAEVLIDAAIEGAPGRNIIESDRLASV